MPTASLTVYHSFLTHSNIGKSCPSYRAKGWTHLWPLLSSPPYEKRMSIVRIDYFKFRCVAIVMERICDELFSMHAVSTQQRINIFLFLSQRCTPYLPEMSLFHGSYQPRS